jgi:ribosomal protein S18
MFGGLEGTEEELLYVDDKMYPRRKIETIQRLMEELDENDLKEWLIRDILKPRGKRMKKNKHVKAFPINPSDVLKHFDELIEEITPQNKIIEDFKSPAQKEFAVSEAIKVAKKAGRPKKYHTEEERKKAKREMTVESNRLKRQEKAKKLSENPEIDYKQYAEELKNFIIPGETTSFLKRLQEKEKENSNDDDDNDFPLNQIIEPVSSTKSNTGAGIKKIVKRKLGEAVRGDIVAEIMRKMGLSLPEASRYVKLHNLY